MSILLRRCRLAAGASMGMGLAVAVTLVVASSPAQGAGSTVTVKVGPTVSISALMSETSTTAQCASGLVVGGGNEQTIGDETQMNSNGLRVNGIVPSINGTEPQGAAGWVGADATRVIADGNTGGGTQAGFTVRSLAMCLVSDVVTHTQVVMNKLVGAAGRVTAVCPTGSRLLGGGGRVTPGTVGNMKISALYPTFNDGAHLFGAKAAADGELNPDAWTAVALINGSPSNPVYTTYAYALCTGTGVNAAAVKVKVRNREEAGPLTATTSRRMPIACQSGDGQLLNGGASIGGTDNAGAGGSGITNRSGYVIPSTSGGSDGDHLNGSFPSTSTGGTLTDGATAPSTWTAFTHTGGVDSAATFSNVWALCATFTPGATPMPTPNPNFRTLPGAGPVTLMGQLAADLSALTINGGPPPQVSFFGPTGSPTITTKDPATNPNCTINRPTTSAEARAALLTEMSRGFGCLTFVTVDQLDLSPTG